ncbi:hypothetical protein Pcinc_006096 [Petrolisthes cinctipes]|uniref:Uncharacterized protein n=1 Tax=Petrolisthes cinctipes TaxID=88211 RepID=A0AAE1KZH1_PETCI|nr:hypothetical protein Pcinc_006096 [Petrolisthes cinctipes]
MSNSSNDFDVSKNIKFVPKFDEDSPDDFFCLFEKIAKHMEWPTSRWSFLAQSVFVGKARSVFVSLQDDQSNNYVILKECVLGAYDQIPENHRQMFRKCKIEESQTYLEFVRHKTKLFDRAKQKGNDVTRRASHLYSQQGGKSSLSGASLPDSFKTFETSSELPFVSKPDTPAFAITRNMTRNNHDVLDNNAYGSNVNDNPSGFDISSLFEDSTVDSESSKNTQVQDHLPSDHACVLEKLLKTFPQICGDVPRQCRMVEHDIVLVEGAQPVKQAFYRMSADVTDIYFDEVGEQTSEPMTEEPSTAHMAPASLIPVEGNDHSPLPSTSSVTLFGSTPLPSTSREAPGTVAFTHSSSNQRRPLPPTSVQASVPATSPSEIPPIQPSVTSKRIGKKFKARKRKVEDSASRDSYETLSKFQNAEHDMVMKIHEQTLENKRKEREMLDDKKKMMVEKTEMMSSLYSEARNALEDVRAATGAFIDFLDNFKKDQA